MLLVAASAAGKSAVPAGKPFDFSMCATRSALSSAVSLTGSTAPGGAFGGGLGGMVYRVLMNSADSGSRRHLNRKAAPVSGGACGLPARLGPWQPVHRRA